MSQRHGEQFGTFHITTNSRNRTPWCTLKGVPDLLIDNLMMTTNQHKAVLFAFCVLPDHMHIVVNVSERGLSKFVQSLKQNSSRDVRVLLGDTTSRSRDSRVPTAPKDKTKIQYTRWQEGFYDELIRDQKQLNHAVTYVQENALKHDLVDDPLDWPWTSLHFPYLIEFTFLHVS